jgi:hypothetical protein
MFVVFLDTKKQPPSAPNEIVSILLTSDESFFDRNYPLLNFTIQALDKDDNLINIPQPFAVVLLYNSTEIYTFTESDQISTGTYKQSVSMGGISIINDSLIFYAEYYFNDNLNPIYSNNLIIAV